MKIKIKIKYDWKMIKWRPTFWRFGTNDVGTKSRRVEIRRDKGRGTKFAGMKLAGTKHVKPENILNCQLTKPRERTISQELKNGIIIDQTLTV